EPSLSRSLSTQRAVTVSGLLHPAATTRDSAPMAPATTAFELFLPATLYSGAMAPPSSDTACATGVSVSVWDAARLRTVPRRGRNGRIRPLGREPQAEQGRSGLPQPHPAHP